MARLEGKTALVTGGALGIGRACALAMAREGAKLVVTDILEAEGAAVANEIEESGGEAIFVSHNVTDEDAWVKALEEARSRFGGLNILVNNAGIAISGPLTEMSFEDWRRQMDINVDGVFLGTKHAIPLMAASGGGSIIMMSSLAGLKGAPGLAGYNATKGAVRLLTKGVALECARGGTGIRVNSVHPGLIETAIWDSIGETEPGEESMLPRKEGSNRVDLDQMAELAVPLGFVGRPEDIANGVVFLASEESRYMTGAELVIDGGMSA